MTRSPRAAADPLERLRSRLARLRAPLCAGIDPDPHAFPAGIPATAAGLERFTRGLVEAVAPHVVAVKFNAAFFEAFGSAGWAVLERARADVPSEVFVIIDAKRGDVATSAERYAEAVLGRLAADGVTVSPYLGEDSVEPFVRHARAAFVYLLARTSNPSAATFQDAPAFGHPLYERVAEWAAERWPDDRVGLVVGATTTDELRRIRALVPALPFLVPGVGAQGGDLAAAVETCHGVSTPGLVTVSRAIASASSAPDWQREVAAAADSWRHRMLEAGATLPA
ncbi:MAG: orotidine-5'-phosphate decarboxylase [Candidatus Limnocylindria bacterium]